MEHHKSQNPPTALDFGVVETCKQSMLPHAKHEIHHPTGIYIDWHC